MLKLIINAKIYTCGENASVCSAMCIENGRILDIGSSKSLIKKYGDNALIVDMEGRCILPGLYDSHLHLTGLARQLNQLDLSSLSKKEAFSKIAARVAETKKGEWIKGRGWNNELWGEDLPTAGMLDEIAPDNPVMLTRTCGHSTWVNTKAIELLKIDADTKNPVGGEILRYPDGKATGLLSETAQELLSGIVPVDAPLNTDDIVKAQSYLHSLGVVSIGDAGTDETAWQLYNKVQSNGDLTLNIYCMKSVDVENLQNIPKPMYRDDNSKLTMRCAKLFSDGSLGSKGAWLTTEYADRPNHYGNGRYSDEELCSIVLGLHNAGYQVAIHAIGDMAIKQCLTAYGYAQESDDMELRHRIEHYQVNNPEDILKTSKLNVIPSMQSCHMATDWRMAESKLGEKSGNMFMFKDILAEGLIIPNGSDSPVEPPNPFYGIHAATSRKDRSLLPENGYEVDQAMTRIEALHSYTIWPAYTQFEEDIKGKLENGYIADFVVIDRDYFGCMTDEIKDINVMETWIDGNMVYSAEV